MLQSGGLVIVNESKIAELMFDLYSSLSISVCSNLNIS